MSGGHSRFQTSRREFNRGWGEGCGSETGHNGNQAFGRWTWPRPKRTFSAAERGAMHNEFTAIVEQDGEWFIASCPEVPGANGQGRSKDDAVRDLADAVELILQDRREDALRKVPPKATRETIILD